MPSKRWWCVHVFQVLRLDKKGANVRAAFAPSDKPVTAPCTRLALSGLVGEQSEKRHYG